MAMFTMNIEVKELNEMSEEELNVFFDTKLDEGKGGLLQFAWAFLQNAPNRDEVIRLFDLYLRSDSDAAEFLNDHFDGNIDDFEGNIQRFIKSLYEQQEYD